MEQYTAENMTPLDRCLQDVRSADVYIVVVGWRYGHVPDDDLLNPGKRSITELELEEAEKARKHILAFLLDPQTPWPPSASDVFTGTGGKDILSLRAKVGGRYLAGVFQSPDSLASQAAVAVSRLGISEQMVERALGLTTLTGQVRDFATGNPLADTTVTTVIHTIAEAGTTRALEIPLEKGGTWWSTRLYLLAVLAQTLTSVRQFVFSHADGKFAGMASPTTVREGLSAAFPALAKFDAEIRSGSDSSKDTDREINRCIGLWNQQMIAAEPQIKVGVRPQLLAEWFGERFVNRCIRIDGDARLTMVQVQQLVDSLIPDVPVERATDAVQPAADDGEEANQPPKLMVVDRDAFALELARQWVRTGMPRTPIL